MFSSSLSLKSYGLITPKMFHNVTFQEIDVQNTIDNMARKLMHRRQLFNVISIPTAKVPIVKFTDRETRLDGDISLYNTLVSE